MTDYRLKKVEISISLNPIRYFRANDGEAI